MSVKVGRGKPSENKSLGHMVRAKWCWVARETRQGWRLKLCVGNDLEFPVRGFLADKKSIQRVVRDGVVVFVHLADSTMTVGKRKKNR